MSAGIIGLISIFVLIALVLLRMPVGVALGIVGVVGYAIVDGWSPALNRLGNTAFSLAQGYSLSVVPMFLLMGAVASRSGMSYDLFRAANGLFAGRRGTLAMATIGACAGFGAICGSSLATAATMSRIAIPEMLRYGYRESLATGVVASGGTLGILIPPSVILVVYAIIAQESVAELFAAGLLPGITLAALHVLVIVGWCHWIPDAAPVSPTMSPVARLRNLLGMWQMVVLFGVSVGGIYVGLFSPTEAAAVGALGAIVLGTVMGRLSRADIGAAMLETVRTTAILFFIVIAAFIYSYFLVQTRLPTMLVDWVGGLGLAPMLVMLIIIGFYVILGCFLDAMGMILITVPVFLPLVTGLGFDAVWFGVLVVVVVEIGLITPPVGMNLFLSAMRFKKTLPYVYRSVIPMLLVLLAGVLLITYVPILTLALPGLLK